MEERLNKEKPKKKESRAKRIKERLDARISVYLSEAEMKMLRRQAGKAGLTVPDYMRKVIRKYIP